MEKKSGCMFKAVREGNVEFLIESLATQPPEYFYGSPDKFNIIQLTIYHEQAEFLKQALERMPNSTIQHLLCQHVISFHNYNTFHMAAARGNLTIVQLLVNFTKQLTPSSSSGPSTIDLKPWLASDENGRTPFHVALDMKRDDCALELMSLDMQLLCDIHYNTGASPFLHAIRQGCANVVKTIMKSGFSYSTRGDDELTPLDVAPNCSDEILEQLLNTHPGMIKKRDNNGLTFLHKWVQLDKVWPFELLLKQVITNSDLKDFIHLLCMVDYRTDDNPLHIAAYNNSEESFKITQLLVQAYNKAKGEVLPLSPWRRRNKDGNTPLLVALFNKHESLALYYISLDYDELVVISAKSVLYAAVWNKCDAAVQMILTLHDPSRCTSLKLKANEGKNVLHVASNCTETTAKLLLDTFPNLINEPDSSGKTPLDIASELGTAWLIKLLLIKDSSLYKTSAWIEACKRGHVPSVEAFIEYSPDFRKLCIDEKDTPLHHIKLQSYSQYQKFLAIPLLQEMINNVDSDGSTPLHRALERNDLIFAEVLLLTGGVSRNIPDKKGKTATNLLQELCEKVYQDGNNPWELMCQRIGINPWLNFRFIQPNTMGDGASILTAVVPSVGEMRGTLSVVAALLATLTFAAGFTLPGGLNEETGEALLAKKASFLVFMLADAYAMCCAMLVLFFIMWSMVIGDQDRSLVLVDRSVLIIKQALYGTLLAFMTGVYTVIAHKSLWASILIFFMCSFVALVAISANRNYLYIILDKLAPSTSTKRRGNYQSGSLEEGTALASRGGDSTVDHQSDTASTHV